MKVQGESMSKRSLSSYLNKLRNRIVLLSRDTHEHAQVELRALQGVLRELEAITIPEWKINRESVKNRLNLENRKMWDSLQARYRNYVAEEVRKYERLPDNQWQEETRKHLFYYLSKYKPIK